MIGLSFGVLGVAVGLTAAGFLLMPVLLLIQRRLTGVLVSQQVGRLVAPVHAALWGALAYLGVRLLADGRLLTLLMGSFSYALAVMIVLWLVSSPGLGPSGAGRTRHSDTGPTRRARSVGFGALTP